MDPFIEDVSHDKEQKAKKDRSADIQLHTDFLVQNLSDNPTIRAFPDALKERLGGFFKTHWERQANHNPDRVVDLALKTRITPDYPSPSGDIIVDPAVNGRTYIDAINANKKRFTYNGSFDKLGFIDAAAVTTIKLASLNQGSAQNFFNMLYAMECRGLIDSEDVATIRDIASTPLSVLSIDANAMRQRDLLDEATARQVHTVDQQITTFSYNRLVNREDSRSVVSMTLDPQKTGTTNHLRTL